MAYLTQTEYRIARAIAQINSDYGDVVSVDQKNKALIKYGRNDNIGSSIETVWLEGDDETYPTGNNIDIVVSTNGSDSQDVVIEGHTLSGSDLTFVSQTATLNGTSNVSLTTPLYRANRMYNNDSTDFAGDVTVEDNGTSTHLLIPSGENQSLKCATSLSSQDYWIVTQVVLSVDRQQTRSVDFNLQTKEFGKVWRAKFRHGVSSNVGTVVIPMEPCMIIVPNSDIRMRAISSNSGTGVSASIYGYLAKIL